MTTPLSGIRILDFTRYQQGPFASVMLADMGAEVIKVEEPDGGGEYGRRLWKERDGFTGFWEACNRGKKSVCIDLRKPEGRDAALDLGATCDVVIENFRAGTMDAWGLGYEEFRARNPRIIYGQATGWGTKGPLASYPSFDQISQAYSGFAQHSGGGPGCRPEIPYPGLADQSGAMNFAFGIMTALFARERTGLGQRVEVSLLGTQLALQSPELVHTMHTGKERERAFRAAPIIGHYECSDGRWVMIVGVDPKYWPRVMRALGIEELIDDPRFARGYARQENRHELEPLMEKAFRAMDSAHWLARLRDADVPAAIVQEYAEVATDEQALANGYIVEQQHPRFGLMRTVGLHVQLSGTPGEIGAPAPDLGRDTNDVLRAAGFSEDRLGALAAAGVILQS
ncbi:MAG: CoA transferase [Chloroflexi bacterium]|nr:CoA transferase [Chloroflexota bacterium]